MSVRFLVRLPVAVAADVAALVVSLVPRRHRHAWVSSELARGNWTSEPGLDICARNPRHTRNLSPEPRRSTN